MVHIVGLLPAIGDSLIALVDMPSFANVDTGFPNPVYANSRLPEVLTVYNAIRDSGES
jgi:hypothetical protein